MYVSGHFKVLAIPLGPAVKAKPVKQLRYVNIVCVTLYTINDDYTLYSICSAWVLVVMCDMKYFLYCLSRLLHNKFITIQ